MSDDGGMRREYGSGSVYQLPSGKWRGAAQAGFTSSGGRKRVTVTGRSEAEAKRLLRDKIAEVRAGEVVMSPTTTVKAWSDTWLAIKQRELSPKGYNAVRSPIRTHVIPTIGHRRLTALTPADVRAVEDAQRTAGPGGTSLKGATRAATQRALFNMLRAAIAEGHAVPTRVLMTKMPKADESDRQPLTIPEVVRMLAAASELPHGTRWAVALLNGMRQGECLGLTWDAIDFDTNTINIEWQLQRLPYLDPKNRSKGFRVPDGYQRRQIHKAWHLVRPKSKAGHRSHPLLEPVADALRTWREIAPTAAHGLVWPADDGKPRDHQHDLQEWHDLQDIAGVRHPTGRHYHVHECRNVTATELRNSGADDLVTTSLLGHTTASTSHGYMRVDQDAKRAALEKVATRLGIT